MTDAVRSLISAAAALAAGNRDALAARLLAAQAAAGTVATEEMLLQSYLFLGYPRALQGLMTWREVSGTAAQAEAAEDAHTWEARGEEVCRTVYGGQYERLRANVARLHADMERWMVHEGYGKVLGRPGLELPARELCIVAMLVVQDAPAQLYSHLRGALNAGAKPGDVEAALELASGDSGAVRGERARAVWAEVRGRTRMRGERNPDTVD
jgi:4-carboxymuconolactone decarboxylase